MIHTALSRCGRANSGKNLTHSLSAKKEAPQFSMRTAVTWLAVGTAACAAIAVAMHVRRRNRLSDLENRVGNPKRRALSKRRERNARQLAANKMYYAFVSHMKVEAAMEARFLQIELESLHDDEVSSSISEIMRTCSDRVFSQLTSKCLLLPTVPAGISGLGRPA